MSNYTLFVKRHGFTLIELMVSIAVIAAVSAIVLSNGRSLNDTISLSSVAEDMSLAIREAQLYGTAVRENSSSQFTSSYGIVFSLANANTAIVFADTNANGVYDGLSTCSGECVDRQVLRNSVKVSQLCAVMSNGNQRCGPNWREIDLVFTRPSLDAMITVVDNSGFTVSGSWQSATITFASPFGATKTITVNAAGLVSVQ